MREFETTTGADKKRSYNGDYMETGKSGEEIIHSWLLSFPKVSKIEDVRGDVEMQEKDVDWIVVLQDGRRVMVEAKTDNHLHSEGNFLFEVLRINHTASPDKALGLGWSFRSSAEIFAFYSTREDAIYTLNADKFRSIFQKYTREKREKSTRIWVNTDEIKSTLAVLIPVRYCEGTYTKYNSEVIHQTPTPGE